VIRGADDHSFAIHHGGWRAVQARKPHGKLLEPPERPARFGQLILPLECTISGVPVGFGDARDEVLQLQKGIGHQVHLGFSRP
jgi:hypothetical protein